MRTRVSAFILIVLLCPTAVTATGDPSRSPSFTLALRPDAPLDRFAAGKLGVVLPSMASSYLVVAYRYLAGMSPTEDQQRAILSVWHQRLGGARLLVDHGYIPIEPEMSLEDSLDQWLATRNRVPGAPSVSFNWWEANKENRKGYFQFLNCTAGAFGKASETLAERIQHFGVESDEVASWLLAQDAVFDNCSGKKAAAIPPAASPDDDPLLRYDRAYQIAAAHFYAGNFAEAQKQCEAIASDGPSPWRDWARLVLARILVRRVDLEGESPALIASASAALKDILNDDSQVKVHAAARSMLHIICARRHDPTAAAYLASGILRPNSVEDFAWDFNAFTHGPLVNHKIDPAVAEDDLTRWIGAFAGVGEKGYANARWRKEHSLPWLVATLANANSGDSSLPELLKEAAKVEEESVAWPTVTYHRLRLEPSKAKARGELDALLPLINRSLPASSRNLFAELRFALAEDLDDLLRQAPRVPVAIVDDERGESDDASPGQEPFFDQDAACVFNVQLPLSMLVQATQHGTLPPRLRKELTHIAWVRAVLLGDQPKAKELARLMISLNRDTPLSAGLTSYVEAKSTPERDIAAAMVIGRNPGLSCWVRQGFLRSAPPHERGSPHTNWWAFDGIAAFQQANRARRAPAFLTESQRATATTEYQKLLTLGNGPTCLGQLALNAVTALPNDPRVPELLYLVVRASREGRGDAQTGRWSKAAFDMLHTRFPKSEWTERTPYWYR